MTTKGYPVPPPNMGNERAHRELIAQCLQGAMQGKLNAVTKVTLTPSATTTTITDARIGAETHFSFSPLTLNAVTALASGLYVSSQQKGSAVLTHASSANADQTFSVLMIG